MTTALVLTFPDSVQPQTLLQFRQGDDWLISGQIVTQTIASDGTITTAPFDLTGCSLAAAVYSPLPYALNGYNGSIVIGSAVAGTWNARVSAALTQNLPIQISAAQQAVNNLSIALIDSLDNRRTFDPIGIASFYPSSNIPVPVNGNLVINAGAQGPAGTPGIVSLISGAGAPGDNDGVNGQFYLGSTPPALYGPKLNGRWPLQCYLFSGVSSAQSLDFSQSNNAEFTNQ